MDSFEYLTSTSDYVDTFSFVSANTEEQDQFMQCIDNVESANSSSSSPSYSLMGLMLNNGGSSVHALKSAIGTAKSRDHQMHAGKKDFPDSKHLDGEREEGETLLPTEFIHDEITSSRSFDNLSEAEEDDVNVAMEKRVNKLVMEMTDDETVPPTDDMARGDGGDRNVMEMTDDQTVPPTDNAGGEQQRQQREMETEGGQTERTNDKENGSGEEEDNSETNDDNNGNSKDLKEDDDSNDKDNESQDQEFDEQYLKDRAWTVLYNMKNEKDKTIGNKFSVQIKTRSDKEQHVIPERLYSSLKYEFRQSIYPELRMTDTGIMMCKMEIVNPKDPSEELYKANGERLIRGIQDFTVITMNKHQTALEVKSKFQFTGVSYHHDKKYFAMKLSYYDPSFDMSKPVFSIVSAPFQVFARRPTIRSGAPSPISSSATATTTANVSSSSGDEDERTPTFKRSSNPKRNSHLRKQEKKKKTTEKKAKSPKSNRTTDSKTSSRKRKSPSLSIEIPEDNQASSVLKKAKRQKTTNDDDMSSLKQIDQQEIGSAIESTQDAAFANYMNCLELLIGFKKNLKAEEQKLALEIAHAKLFPDEHSNNDQHTPLPDNIFSSESNEESSMFFSS